MSAALPPPVFIDTDAEALTRRLVDSYETVTGRTLMPAQPERLFVDWLAYHLTLQRIEVQDAGELTLLALSRAPFIDHIGVPLGVARLPARAARAMFEVRLAASIDGERTVGPFRVRSNDGVWTFVGDAAPVPAGAAAIEVWLTATEAGAGGNGYAPGQISTLDEPIAGVVGVVNLSVSYGGAAEEDDERLRLRIQEAPEKFSTAGPVGAYRWHAMAAHQSVTDVAVASPVPGRVHVTVLTDRGPPDDGLIDLIAQALNHEKARPLCDTVTVSGPAPVRFTLSARVTPSAGIDRPSVRAAVLKAAETCIAAQSAGLGRSLIPSQAIAALQNVPGVRKVELVEPGARVLAPHEWATGTLGAIEFTEGADV